MKPRSSRRKEIRKIRAERNEIRNKETIEKPMKVRACSLKR